MYVLYRYEHPEHAVYSAHQRTDRVYGPDSYFRGVYRMLYRSVSDPDGRSHADDYFCGDVPDPAADRGQPDLPESGGKLGWASVYLGTGGGDYRRQFDGRGGHAYLYTDHLCGLYIVSGECV